MDMLLHELRRHMAELSIQGDDFTRQMWQMYAVFEELLERQLGSTDSSRSPRRCESYKRRIKPSNTYESNRTEEFEFVPQELGNVDDPFSADDLDIESYGQPLYLEDMNVELLNQLEATFHRQLVLGGGGGGGGGGEFVGDELLQQSGHSEECTILESIPYFYYSRRNHSLHKNYTLNEEYGGRQQREQQRSVRRHHKHEHRRRLPETPLLHQHQSHSILSLVPSDAEHLTKSFPTVNVEFREEMDDSNESNESLSSSFTLSKRQSSIPYRRSSAPELLDNPLLETISSIEDICESDDYGELPQSDRSGCLMSVSDKDGFRMEKTPSLTLSSDDRAQPLGDGDHDSVGYAGSNSVDSGYKSSCPTPELLDPCYYAQDALCGGSSSSANKRALLSSAIRANRETKPRIPMGTRVIGRHTRSSTTPWSTLLSTSSHSSSSSGGGASSGGGDGGTTLNRVEYGYYDVNLDHLMYLRQSLLSAIQKCGGSVLSDQAGSLSDMECREVTTGNMGAFSGSSGMTSYCDTGDNSVHMSPTRSRSGSRTSGESPDLLLSNSQSKSTRFAMEGVNVLDGVSEYDAILPSTSYDTGGHTDIGNMSAALTDSAPVATPSCPLIAMRCENSLTVSMSEKEPISLQNVITSKTPSVLTDKSVDYVAADSNKKMFDRAEYYDLESVEDFPCSYGTVLENKYLHSSLARVKKLKVDPKYDDFKSQRSASCSKEAFEVSSSKRELLPQESNSEINYDFQLPEHCIKSDRAVANMVALHTIHPEWQYSNQHLNSVSSVASTQSQNAKVSILCDSAVDQARFSQVASCMLKIIDDLHQHQQKNAENPTKKTQGSPGSADIGISFPDKRSSSPVTYDGQLLSGADYHVYEEIAYDTINRGDGKSGITVQGRRVLPGNVPPPLPARPNEIFGSTSVSSPTKNIRPSKMENNQRMSHFSLEPNVPKQFKKSNFKKRSNLYSIFTEQSDRRHLSQSLEKEWQTCNTAGVLIPATTFGEISVKSPATCCASKIAAVSSSTKESNDDDEYGFNAIVK